MDTLETVINNYLEYCNSQKCLDEKTLKAYRIDLRQFSEQISIINIAEITSKTLEHYIARLHEQYKPKTVKRKIASVKPYSITRIQRISLTIIHSAKILIHFREPVILPKTIPLHTVETFLSTIYKLNGKMPRLLTRKGMLLEMLLLRNYYLQPA